MGQQDLLAWIYRSNMICKKKDKMETLQLDGPAGCACSSEGQHFHIPSWSDESPGDKVQTQSYNSYDILHILYVQ